MDSKISGKEGRGAKRFEEILESLERMFPGKILLPIEDTARALGCSTQTIYNGTGRKARKRFPVKPVRTGKSLKFRIHDVARYIAEL